MNYVFPGSAHATAVGAPRVLPGLNSNTPKNTAAEIVYSPHFPGHWQGTAITNDFRANRTVRYKLSPFGSGYQSEEVETVLRSDHRSYRPVDSKIGPDGALYIVDWYNPIIDHGEVDFHHPIRDRKHGRVWRLTRKGSPVAPVRDFNALSEEQLLELLNAPEQITRLLANRAYVERQGDPGKVIAWAGRQQGSSRSQNRLEGLWLLASLNHFDEQLLRTSLTSGVAQERAAAVRMMRHYSQQSAFSGDLSRLINDPHPQVRLETIHALRAQGTRQAAELMVQALEHSTDDNIDFALDLSLRDLKDTWLPPLKDGEVIFGGNKESQLFALLTIEDTSSRGLLNELVLRKDLDTTLIEQAWTLLAKIGDAATRKRILQKALAEDDPRLLRIMVNAPQEYNAKPVDNALLKQFLNHDRMIMRQSALELVGRWQISSLQPEVEEVITRSNDLSEKMTGYKALWQLGQEDRVTDEARNASGALARTAATNVWISEDAASAARNSVDLLVQSESTDQAESIFVAFRRVEEGPEVLIEALKGQQIPEHIANVGLKVAQTSGLNLKSLEEALRQAGNIKPLGTEMSREEKESLISDALKLENVGRGRQIYRQKELLCATCHRVDGIGGLIGPDLSTVGSYMTPNSLLESILNPNSDIKQNYETVLITRKNGEIFSGRLERKTNNSTLLRQTNNEIIEIPESEISKVDVSPASLMPPGLTRNLSRDELKDLLSYLISLGKNH